VSRFRFVDDHRDLYEVKRLCELVEVSRSGYYAWRDRPASAREIADGELLEVIGEIHERSRGTYGRPRITGQLRRRGYCVNHKRVGRLMRQADLAGLSNRKRWRRGRDKVGAPAPDLLERDFSAQAPNQRWVADITEFATDEGRLYLAGVLDLYARRVVGWAMGPRRNAELVVDALAMAIARREPSAGVIHHADLGSQYTSMAFCDSALDAQVALSFGSVGDAFDNAAMEAFWSTLKRELAHIHAQRRWASRAELRAALFDYIEAFYNRARHQAGLGHLTPAEFEDTLNAA
jgi:putative transposase